MFNNFSPIQAGRMVHGLIHKKYSHPERAEEFGRKIKLLKEVLESNDIERLKIAEITGEIKSAEFRFLTPLVEDHQPLADIIDEGLLEAMFSNFCAIELEDVVDESAEAEDTGGLIARVQFNPQGNFINADEFSGLIWSDPDEVVIFREELRKEAENIRQKIEVSEDSQEIENFLTIATELDNIESAWLDPHEHQRELDWAVEDGIIPGEIANEVRNRASARFVEKFLFLGTDSTESEVSFVLTGLFQEMETNRRQEFAKRKQVQEQILDLFGDKSNHGAGNSLRRRAKGRVDRDELQIYKIVRELSKNPDKYKQIKQSLSEDLREEIERSIADVERRKPLVIEVEERWSALTMQFVQFTTVDPVGIVESNRPHMRILMERLLELQEDSFEVETKLLVQETSMDFVPAEVALPVVRPELGHPGESLDSQHTMVYDARDFLPARSLKTSRRVSKDPAKKQKDAGGTKSKRQKSRGEKKYAPLGDAFRVSISEADYRNALSLTPRNKGVCHKKRRLQQRPQATI